MKQVRNFDKDNNMNLDYNYNYISNLEKSKQNYYNRKDNNNYYISDLERSKQNYYNLKENKNNDYYIYFPNQNELFTFGDNDNENKNLNNKKINNNNKNQKCYNNPLVTKLSNIANSISILDYLIKNNIYDNFISKLKFKSLFSKVSRFIIRLYRFYINTSKKKIFKKIKRNETNKLWILHNKKKIC